MAQETPVEYAEPGMHHDKTQSGQVNVRAVEAAIAAGLSEIPIVKKVYCTNNGHSFETAVVHSSTDNGAALELIVERMVDIENKVERSGDAPDDICLVPIILQESDDHAHGNWGEKILFERG